MHRISQPGVCHDVCSKPIGIHRKSDRNMFGSVVLPMQASCNTAFRLRTFLIGQGRTLGNGKLTTHVCMVKLQRGRDTGNSLLPRGEMRRAGSGEAQQHESTRSDDERLNTVNLVVTNRVWQSLVFVIRGYSY